MWKQPKHKSHKSTPQNILNKNGSTFRPRVHENRQQLLSNDENSPCMNSSLSEICMAWYRWGEVRKLEWIEPLKCFFLSLFVWENKLKLHYLVHFLRTDSIKAKKNSKNVKTWWRNVGTFKHCGTVTLIIQFIIVALNIFNSRDKLWITDFHNLMRLWRLVSNIILLCPKKITTERTWQRLVHSEVFHFNSLKSEAIFLWGSRWLQQNQLTSFPASVSVWRRIWPTKASVTLVGASTWL